MLLRRIDNVVLAVIVSSVAWGAMAGSATAAAAPSAASSKAVAPFTGERDALDSFMTDYEQWECGMDRLTADERIALMKILLKAYQAGQEQQYIVMSSFGSFTAGLVEFTGSRFIFDLNPIEMQRLKRAAVTLEWLPESRLALFPYQVSWIRR